MGWWSDFDPDEVDDDFLRISEGGFDSVRIFLTWEDFQPDPQRVDTDMLHRLVGVADAALERGLSLIPTLFTGHMSGVNWIPAWALEGSDPLGRFRVSSGGRMSTSALRNWYGDDQVREAQVRMASEAAAALAGHDALWAWDLGNENSNCVIPRDRDDGRRWLNEITTAIRRKDHGTAVTIGLHMEDLEEDRNMGPAEAAEVCDFLTMHGYPIYADWALNSTDESILSFLALITGWLGGGSDVLFSEFGTPTFRRGDSQPPAGGPVLIEEQASARYTARALGVLRRAGCLGAMVWCYSDYPEEIWGTPPLDLAPHERSFGIWRSDGSPKPSLDSIRKFSRSQQAVEPDLSSWIDIETSDYYRDPRRHLERLYLRYRSEAKSNPR
jgi:endo-1,4-beta-mannosidase